MQAIPLIISAVGTAATISAQNEQDRKQRQILNQQMERTDKASKDASQQVLQEGQRYTQGAREQGLQQAEDQGYQQTQADLNGAGGSNIAAAADAGNVSDDFLKSKAQTAVDEGNRLTAVAREVAKARAPGQLQMGDRLSMNDLAGNLQSLWGTTKNMGSAAGLDAQSVQMPAYGQLGKVASSIGGAMAKGGYGQGSGGTPPNPYASGINF